METSEPHPLTILQEDQEEIVDDQPPERSKFKHITLKKKYLRLFHRPADRIQWVRRTLHGDSRRRNPHRFSNYRHSSLSARPSPGSPHYDFTTSLSVMERLNSPKRTDSLTESLPHEPIGITKQQSIYLFIYLSLYLSMYHLSIYVPSIYLFIIYLSIYHLSTQLFIYLCIYLSLSSF